MMHTESGSYAIEGACHCGNLSFTIDTQVAPQERVARACGCSFCRMHGTKTWSDPNGQAILRVKDEVRLNRYRFGLQAIDFYICRTCGTYTGGVLTDDEGAWATLNMRLTEQPDIPDGAVHYDNQSAKARAARRKNMWTPVRVVIG